MITIRKNSAASAEILLYGQIGRDYWSDEGMSDKDFIAKLDELGPVLQIDLRINSSGGNIIDAWGIYSALNRHPANITTHIDGLAASCASWIAQAGDTINISEVGMMMIHSPESFIGGSAEKLRKEADVLDGMSSSIAGIYAARSGKPIEEWTAAMQAETWYSSSEAIAAGLATNLIPNKGFQTNGLHSFDLSKFRNTPKQFLNTLAAARQQVQNENRRRRLDLIEKEAEQVFS